MGVKISDLPEGTAPVETEEIPISDGTTTRKVDIGRIPAMIHPSYLRWEDLRVTIGQLKPKGVGNDPTNIAWKTDLILSTYDQGDEQIFGTQIPHNYKEGSNIRAHVHWTPHSRGVAESGKTVEWKLDYVIASMDGAFGSLQTITFLDTCAGVDDQHQYITGDVEISGSGIGISAMLIGRFYRGISDTWSDNGPSNRPGLLELDFHFLMDAHGSEEETSK